MTFAEPENRIDLLKRSILRDLPPDDLEVLSRTLGSRTAGPGELIFKEGDPGDAFYIVGSGQVRIFVRHENSVERELSVCGPGEHFGEVALLAGAPRTANVQSVGETQLIVFTKEQFDQLLRDYPDLSRKFVSEIRNWLMKDQEIIEEEASVVMRASRFSMLDFLIIAAVSVILAITFNMTNPNGVPLIPERPESIPSISASAVMQGYRQGNTVIVDAMPNNFYQKRHIKGAVNMPMTLFDIVYLMKFSEEDKDRKIVVYGNSISRPYDQEIAGKLLLRGYSDVKVMAGGLKAWEADGYPVEEQVSK
jgi:CRP-like cAMP-binding protein/rhodanese-related sulfurtransferase